MSGSAIFEIGNDTISKPLSITMTKQNQKNANFMDDDLDNLLNDITLNPMNQKENKPFQNYSYAIPEAAPTKSHNGVREKIQCYPLVVGGSKLVDGCTSSSQNPKSCSELRCFSCDKHVLRYRD